MRPANHFVVAVMLVWLAAILWTNPHVLWAVPLILLVFAAGHVAEGMRR